MDLFMQNALKRLKQHRRRVIKTVLILFLLSLLLGAAGAGGALVYYHRLPTLAINHLPETFMRRQGDWTININGQLSPLVTELRFKVNDGNWKTYRQGSRRTPKPLFVMEFRDSELNAGVNKLQVEAKRWPQKKAEQFEYSFNYDRSEIALPVVRTWKGVNDKQLEVEDGWWETFERDGQWRVRPKIGHEGYDRILIITGASAKWRRIETDVIFHYDTGGASHGFGLLPLWAGHPDEPDYCPGRGWSFGLAWYWSRFEGVGNEFSYKYAQQPPAWVNSYRDMTLAVGKSYSVIIETGPLRNPDGSHQAYELKMKWWLQDQPEPANWIVLIDIEGAAIPPGEYGVAIHAHNCQVDFGPVIVTALE